MKLKYGNILPGVAPMLWTKFILDYPRHSIGLDGFVAAGPEYQSTAEGGPRFNFNHHEGVVREATYATCMQVNNAIRTRRLEEFCNHGNACFTWYANDCDEDVCLSTWQLENIDRTIPTYNLLLNKLVEVTNKMDIYSGLYPFPTAAEILRQMAWIYYPYRKARLDGTVDRRDAEEFGQVIQMVHGRINEYLAGYGSSIDLNLDFDVLQHGDGWSMIRETGEHARYALLDKHINAFVSVRNRPDGNFTYSFARLTESVPFPVPYILNRLNEREGRIGTEHQYGGGTTTGGSPRNTGTDTPPNTLFSWIEEDLKTWKANLAQPLVVASA